MSVATSQCRPPLSWEHLFVQRMEQIKEFRNSLSLLQVSRSVRKGAHHEKCADCSGGADHSRTAEVEIHRESNLSLVLLVYEAVGCAQRCVPLPSIGGCMFWVDERVPGGGSHRMCFQMLFGLQVSNVLPFSMFYAVYQLP